MTARAVTPRRASQSRSPARRRRLRDSRLWLAFGVLAALAKTHLIQVVVRHPHSLVPASALCLAGGILRGRPSWMASGAALLLGALEVTTSFLLAVAVAVGAYVVLMALFFAVATVLHARSAGWRP